MTPIQVRNSNGDEVDVPCGKCPLCSARRISSWSFRLLQQEKVSTSAHFITLTYDTDTIPITRNGFMGLEKKDVQLFFKRLRKAHGDDIRIKYFCVGEYGTQRFRPHYHAIIFNARTELIQPAWNKGEVNYGSLTPASVGYCLKYIMKKGRIPMHKNDDRIPEFALMSKGLGLNYVTPEMQAWHLADLEGRMYCNLPDGKKIAMPRYFKEKIYNEFERILAGKSQREQQLQQDEKARAKEKKKGKNDYDLLRATRVDAAFRKMEKSIQNNSKNF